MRNIFNFNQFLESVVVNLESDDIVEVMESMNIWHDALLDSVQAEEVDIYSTFVLPKEDFEDKLDIGFLDKSVEFINSLLSLGLKKSSIHLSDDYSTFLSKPCRFMFIYDVSKNELENPEYILFQSWNDDKNEWDKMKVYKVNLDISRFYDKLSSKTIEILDNGVNYIYVTSTGNEWELQNLEKENDVYLKILRKDNLKQLLKDTKAVINII